MISGGRSSWGHVCQVFYYVKGFSVSLLKCQSSSDKALDIVFNVMCILTSEAHIFLWNQNLCILLGCTNWLGLLTFGFSHLPCSQTKSLIFPLKSALSDVIANENCWGQKSWRHPTCVLLFPSHLPVPSAGSASDRHPEPKPLSSPWQPHWSKLLSPSICKLWSLPVTLFLSLSLTALGESPGNSEVTLLCWSVCRSEEGSPEDVWFFSPSSQLSFVSHVQLRAPCPLVSSHFALVLLKHLDQLTILWALACLPSYLQIFAPMSSWLKDCHFYPL